MILPDLSTWSHDFQSGCLAHAATQRGTPYRRIMAARTHGGTPEPWISLQIGGRGYLFSQALLISNPDPADPAKAHHVNGPLAHVTIDKHAAKGLLAGLGVPVPAGEVFAAADLAQAEAFFARMGGPACVKPARGKQGLCCTPWLRDREAFREAFLTAGRSYPSIVVEEHLEGEQVRFFYVRPSVVGVRLDRPGNVVGDGKRSIAELVAAKNEERRRRASPGAFPVLLDREAHRYLSQQRLALDSRPGAGQRIFLRGTSNPTTGADTVDCRPILHPSYLRLVEDFCGRLPDMRLAAVDMMMHDVTRPAAPGNHWVLELNGAPGMTSFYFPWEGEPQDVAGALIERLMIDRW
jgi:D-alanine-D-alanine ligase-like ATP-grasp enzyme